MLISLAIVIALPKPHGVRALIASTILRLIFSVGLQPTLFLLGAFNVSADTFRAASLLMWHWGHLPHRPPTLGLWFWRRKVSFGSTVKTAGPRQTPRTARWHSRALP